MPYGTNVARSHFAGENLIGRVLITEIAQQQAQVVGVVGDIRGEHLTTPSEPDPTHAYGTSVATRHLPQRLHDEGLVRVQCCAEPMNTTRMQLNDECGVIGHQASLRSTPQL